MSCPTSLLRSIISLFLCANLEQQEISEERECVWERERKRIRRNIWRLETNSKGYCLVVEIMGLQEPVFGIQNDKALILVVLVLL